MWFTRVSLQNPVLATMVMLAFVVLGLFSYQRLKVDQFPNIDCPVVVVIRGLPRRSARDRRSRGHQEDRGGVNTIAGINSADLAQLRRQSVVIIEFNLTSTAARPPTTCARRSRLIRPLLRDEVKDPRVLRFDPASRPSSTWPCWPTRRQQPARHHRRS
jgi:HAE1 family hydrophobic/amphiphilic exporter-1